MKVCSVLDKIEKNTFVVFACASGPVSTNAYLVLCKNTKKAALIDCSPGSFEKFLPVIEELQIVPDQIIFTHSHWDHIADVGKFFKAFQSKILVHAQDAQNIENPGSDGMRTLPTITATTVTKKLEDADVIEIGDTLWKVIHTPGHSPGGICLYNDKEHFLFSGDTLFRGTFGRLDLPTSEPHRMAESLEKLAALPKETEVYSGHGPKTTIGSESWLKDAKKYVI